MRVILKNDIPSLGNFGDTVNVANGYATNYLIPKGLVVEASKGNLKALEQQKEAWLRKAEVEKIEAGTLKERIEALTLSFTRKAGEEEKLFGSVTSMDIADALQEQGFTIDRKKISLDEPIKSLGEFTVHIRLHRDVIADLKVSVIHQE
ncbi:MAG: 50S ribosomal protein L9 [Thermodesulfobacteriota bacterium]